MIVFVAQNEQLYKNKFHFMPKVGFTRISPSDATVKLSNRFAMNSLNITEYLIKQCPHYEKHIILRNDVKIFFLKVLKRKNPRYI